MAPHLIALHGAGMNSHVWDGVYPHLAAAGYGASFRALTLPGHGMDDSALPLTSVAALAQWLRGMIDQAAPGGDIVLIGHSLGAVVALFAADHPRVRAVVAIGAASHLAVNPDLLRLATLDPVAAQTQIIAWGCDRQHPQCDAVKQQLARIMAQVPPAVLAVDLAACDAALPAPVAGKPLLVISGQRDKLTPAAQGQHLATQHGGRWLEMDGGHMLPCERGPAVAAAIVAFIAAL